MRVAWQLAWLLAVAFCPSFAHGDRAPYSGRRDLEVTYGDLTVRHHHDWSKHPVNKGAVQLKVTVKEPFGKDNDYSYLAWHDSSTDRLIHRGPSPALTWIGFVNNGKYVLGLSTIKFANTFQLVLFDSKGSLLSKRRVSEQCTTSDQIESRLSPYDAERREALRDLVAGECLENVPVSESVTNFVRWFDETAPQPFVIERDGAPVALSLIGVAGQTVVIPLRAHHP